MYTFTTSNDSVRECGNNEKFKAVNRTVNVVFSPLNSKLGDNRMNKFLYLSYSLQACVRHERLHVAFISREEMVTVEH